MFYSIFSIFVLFLNIKVYSKVTFSKSDEKENIKWALSRKRCDIAASMCVWVNVCVHYSTSLCSLSQFVVNEIKPKGTLFFNQLKRKLQMFVRMTERQV